MNNYKEKIIEILNDNIENAQITFNELDVNLMELGMDSMAFVRIVVTLEETFSCEIPDNFLLMSEMNTASKIVEIIHNVLCAEKTSV